MLGEGLRAGLNYLGVENRTVCYLEREAYAASVLVARMEDESLDAAPIWPDLLTFDGRPWRGVVDCIAAGFPCQDLSLAGKRAGLDGARSGLFFDILDIADACGARYLFLENVAGIASATATAVDEAEGALEERAAARVLGELADRGWDAEWLTLSASDVGASHGRARWFCFAWRKLDDADRTGAQRTGRAESGAGAGCEELGNAGLQYIDLQQREDGAEHPGTGEPVANTQLPERRALCVCGVGSQQGHDCRRRETHGGTGIADAALGHTGLQHQQPQQRPDGAEHQAAGQLMADTERVGSERRRDAGNVACTCGNAESEARERQRRGLAADGCGGSIFVPGPADNRWPEIIARQPWLAPALSKEAESLLCGAADGLAPGLDFGHRAQRLKCVGNGVVALQAAAAVVQLLRRAVN